MCTPPLGDADAPALYQGHSLQSAGPWASDNAPCPKSQTLVAEPQIPTCHAQTTAALPGAWLIPHLMGSCRNVTISASLSGFDSCSVTMRRFLFSVTNIHASFILFFNLTPAFQKPFCSYPLCLVLLRAVFGWVKEFVFGTWEAAS